MDLLPMPVAKHNLTSIPMLPKYYNYTLHNTAWHTSRVLSILNGKFNIYNKAY